MEGHFETFLYDTLFAKHRAHEVSTEYSSDFTYLKSGSTILFQVAPDSDL